MTPTSVSTIQHVRSVHIDAPVDEVFEHVRDPRSFVAADPAAVALSELTLRPDGVGSSWRTSWHVLGVPVHASWRRTEYDPGGRIVDHASTGVSWQYTTTGDADGTVLSLGYAFDTRSPVGNKVLDRALGNQEAQLDAMLQSFKRAIEGEADGAAPGHPVDVARTGRGWRSAASSAALRARAAMREAMKRAAWAWAGVPSGVLGWVSTRTVFPLTSGTSYRAVADALRVGPEDEVLDVACGSGALLAKHASAARRVAGIDLSDVQIALARRVLRERIAAGTAEVVEGDAGRLPWPDASFTAATCVSSFEVFPSPGEVLREMARVLRPGGRLVANIGERVPPDTETHRVWDTLWVWSEDDVRRMVEDAGFADVTLEYVRAWGGDPVSRFLLWLWRRLGNDMSELRLVRGIKQ